MVVDMHKPDVPCGKPSRILEQTQWDQTAVVSVHDFCRPSTFIYAAFLMVPIHRKKSTLKICGIIHADAFAMFQHEG